jgi:hypothetical protein
VVLGLYTTLGRGIVTMEWSQSKQARESRASCDVCACAGWEAQNHCGQTIEMGRLFAHTPVDERVVAETCAQAWPGIRLVKRVKSSQNDTYEGELSDGTR